MGPDQLAEQLSAVLGGAEILGLTRLSGGASRETWAFDAVDVLGRRELILQRQRSGSDRDMGMEATAVRVAHGAGVPTAEVVAASGTGEQLGAPFMVVQRVAGETIARKILRDAEYADARPVLAAQLGAALARLHTIDATLVTGLEEQDQVQRYRDVLDELGQPHPAFELGFRWLEANRPPRTRTCMVHGDFRMGNIIVGPSGLGAVIDWELIHLSDPMEDLGWLCVKAWRFGSPLPVAGVGAYHDLFDAYGEASGTTVDPEVVRWWETLGTLKWGIMCILQANSHLTGAARSHELAAIGRRVCENEHDLLLLLPGGASR